MDLTDRPLVLTIGHSNHDLEKFVSLLRGAGATLVVDVRSAPVSRWCPHFNGRTLAPALAAEGLGYAYLGEALGGRPRDPTLMVGGKPDYAAMARQPGFAVALDRVLALAAEGTPALMCAERAPADCHRARLVAPALVVRGAHVRHILVDGSLEDHEAIEERKGRDLLPLFDAAPSGDAPRRRR
jgi:uncharacterized protein (DUF488 family)